MTAPLLRFWRWLLRPFTQPPQSPAGYVHHTEYIRCPSCRTVQLARVMVYPDFSPWMGYVHRCENCAYLITESEWEKVSDV